MEPRIVSRLSTTSKIGVGNVPGGRPTSDIVPCRRSIPMACWNAVVLAAVTTAPCAPPISRVIEATGSFSAALTATSAPRLRASASFSSATSTHATRIPIALAYCTAKWPSPPMPEITTHWPGFTSVSLSAL